MARCYLHLRVCIPVASVDTPFHAGDLFRNSDIDIFLYGLDAKAATTKMFAILEHCLKAMSGCTGDLVVRIDCCSSVSVGFVFR